MNNQNNPHKIFKIRGVTNSNYKISEKLKSIESYSHNMNLDLLPKPPTLLSNLNMFIITVSYINLLV